MSQNEIRKASVRESERERESSGLCWLTKTFLYPQPDELVSQSELVDHVTPPARDCASPPPPPPGPASQWQRSYETSKRPIPLDGSQRRGAMLGLPNPFSPPDSPNATPTTSPRSLTHGHILFTVKKTIDEYVLTSSSSLFIGM